MPQHTFMVPTDAQTDPVIPPATCLDTQDFYFDVLNFYADIRQII